MSSEPVSVRGPELHPLRYNQSVYQLSCGTVVELTDGRWGVKTAAGVVLFGGGEDDGYISFMHIMNDLCRCRVLPGKLEITYKPAVPKVTDEEIADRAFGLLTVKELEATRRRVDELSRQRAETANEENKRRAEIADEVNKQRHFHA